MQDEKVLKSLNNLICRQTWTHQNLGIPSTIFVWLINVKGTSIFMTKTTLWTINRETYMLYVVSEFGNQFQSPQENSRYGIQFCLATVHKRPGLPDLPITKWLLTCILYGRSLEVCTMCRLCSSSPSGNQSIRPQTYPTHAFVAVACLLFCYEWFSAIIYIYHS